MAFRNIVIENPAHISLRNEQLIVRSDSEHSVPVEDISAILLENRQSTITTAALSELGRCGCAVFTCDEKHMPCAVLQPFAQHSRELSVLKSQLAMSAPLKKRLWQSTVRQKIKNQALCLRFCGCPKEAEYLEKMILRVNSGDTDNVEAEAARFYFPKLFGSSFFRGCDNGINAGLNYGYAILRGYIARTLAVYGFSTVLGIHHRSTLNSFNLADDLIEPFRPVIDLLVFNNMFEEDTLDTGKKRMLFNSLNLDILSGGRHYSVSYAIELLVQSCGRSIETAEPRLLLPELLEPAQHRYE